jgi:predicted amidohydrolase YtcJ
VKALALTLALAASLANAQRCPPFDIVYYKGNILTGKGLQSNNPERVTALGVLNGRIQDIGTDAQVFAYCNAITKIDLHGAFVMPGFNDAHTHIAYAGQQHLTVDLDNIPSLAAMQEKVRVYTITLTPNQWITGSGWDHTKWASAKLPTRQDLDAVTGTHPAYLERTDGHIAVLNTAALAAANITAQTPDPKGGKIDHNATGQPTGIIRDTALNLIAPHIPKPDAATRRRALTLSLNDALAHGVTSIQDFSDEEDFRVLEAMEHDGQLHVRISEWIPFDLPIATLKQYQSSHPSTDPWLHTGMLKGFMDGSLGSRTAALLAPYSDDPTNSGLPRYDQAKLNQMTTERAEAGFQIGFHAIGDRANSMALTAFDVAKIARMKQLQSILPQLEATTHAHISVTDQSRYRIEHAQVLTPADFDRFAKLHIIASMQPSHLLTDMTWAPARLGPERVKYAYAWKSFLDHGVTLAFGTDYPVESINPFRGLYAAVTRQNETGTQTFQPQEKLTLNQALYAYTQASAFAENAEKQKGILAQGYLADFIILDRDITTATPQQLLHTQVLRTVVGGQTQYQAPQ